MQATNSMQPTNKPQVKYRKDYQPSQYLIKNTKLSFQLFDNYTLVTSELNIERNPLDKKDRLEPIALNGIELALQLIELDGKPLDEDDYTIDAEYLTIKKTTEKFSLKTVVKIHPEKNTSLEGLYTSGGKFCTQCEAKGFRKITYYLDKPEVMSEFKVYVEGCKQKYPLLLSNGNLIKKGQLDNNRHFVEWHDPFPKPCYLFALVAGDLDCLHDQFTTQSGRKVKLELMVDKGKLDQCQFAMDSLKASMKWDEENFGREYDLDLYMIVAVSDFNMGAMENKGLNIFNTKYVLANKKTATDCDFEGVERVIAHEYFHNWTGNRITCRDWFQLSLKEGLTVFRDQLFSEDMQSKAVQRIEQVKVIRSAQFAEDSGPMAHPIRPDSYIEMNNFYTVTVYNKGAEVIRMMHTLLGKEGFRRGMDCYFERHDGQAVTCEDFVKAMEDANQQDWQQFRHWYSQAGTPILKVNLVRKEKNNFELHFSQSCPATPEQKIKKPFMIPLKTGFLDQDGHTISFKVNDSDKVFEEKLLIIDQEKQSISIDCITTDNAKIEHLIPSLLRDFSAPIKLEYNYSQSDLAILFAHDPNTFNRWDAGQNLMTYLLLDDSETINDKNLHIIKTAMIGILDDQQLDNAIKALAISIPPLNSLIGQSDSLKLEPLFNKHHQLKNYLSETLKDTWLTLYKNIQNQSSGDRSLKNTALRYLMVANEEQYFHLAASQQNSADNMTDEISALQIIANTSQSDKTKSIQQFYDKWKNEELVLDKWFSAQVMKDDESILKHVKTLLEHEKFSIENPNKVRAVIGSFVAGNIPQFHHATGQGYEFLADVIIRLNSVNPQIAAGLAKQFNQWKKFDDKRQALIQEQLERIKATDNLSNDVFEVIDKSLKL